jgi:hypothetical protein
MRVAILLVLVQALTAHGLPKLCGKCERYIRGWDVTGVTTTVAYSSSAKESASVCACLDACIDQKNTCAAWVWKFTDNTGHRTCKCFWLGR